MKNKIFKIQLLVLFVCCFSCSKEVIVATESCEIDVEHNSSAHPNTEVYQALLDKYIAKGIPGLSMVVRTPEGKWLGAAGLAKIETQMPMQACQVFHSASVAKTYHVVAAMLLAEEGKLDLDKTIDDYLPDWVCENLPNRTQATVRQLMNHTSGIPDFIESTKHLMDYINDLEHTFSTEEYLDYICDKEPDFAPDTRAVYCNTNTVLLALIMDKIAGSHADVISEKIINSLALQNTYYKNEAGYPHPSQAANTYLDLTSDGTMFNSTEIQSNFAEMSIGHDGMLATAHDFFLFIEAMFKGGLLSQNSLEQMIAPNQHFSDRYGLGLGLEVYYTSRNFTMIGHEGAGLGSGIFAFHIPDKDISFVVCSNFGFFIETPLEKEYYGLINELLDTF